MTPPETTAALACVYCGGPAEGEHSIHRDGYPSCERCDNAGIHEHRANRVRVAILAAMCGGAR